MWIDELLFEKAERDLACEVWVPLDPLVVLGKSNDPSLECNEEICAQLAIPILKRAGGGGTVVLHNGCVVISIGAWMKNPFKNDFYFQLINRVVANILMDSYQLPEITQRGISDLAIGDRKIAGTSLFRSKGYLLYQASVLVNTRIELIEKCLRHPTKEPDYRQGKSHRAFIAGLNDFNPELTPQKILQLFQQKLTQSIRDCLGDELVTTDENHLKWILKRIAR